MNCPQLLAFEYNHDDIKRCCHCQEGEVQFIVYWQGQHNTYAEYQCFGCFMSVDAKTLKVASAKIQEYVDSSSNQAALSLIPETVIRWYC